MNGGVIMGNGGGGGGGCYTIIRELPEDHDILISTCEVAVRLQDDGKALYEFSYDIEGTPTCKPHSTFWFYVPNPINEISDFKASDGEGGLESSTEEFESGGGKKTKFVIKYREEMIPGIKKQLRFSFSTIANIIISKQFFRKLIVYSDYMSHTVECKKLDYKIYPPDGFALYKSKFSHVSLVSDPGGPKNPTQPILLHFEGVDPRSPIPIQVALTSTGRLTKEFWRSIFIFLLAAEVGAIAGWLTSSQSVYAVLAPIILVGIVGVFYFVSK